MKKRERKRGQKGLYYQYIKERYRRICPYGKIYLEELTGRMQLQVLLGMVISTISIVLWNLFFTQELTLYFCGSIFVGCFLVAMEFPNRDIQERENSLYRELLLYLSRVKHNYLISRNVPNAILNASEAMGYEVICHAKEMYQILMEAGRREKVKEYVTDRRGNKYLKLFLVQAYEASEKGDTYVREHTSLFSENIEHLRLELMEELYRRKKRAYQFSGYIFVSIAPVFMMPVLKLWGLGFASELTLFYEGFGKVIELFTLIGTIAVYCLVNRAKEIVMQIDAGHRKEWFGVFWDWKPCQRFAAMLERAEGRYSRKIRELLLQSGENCSFGRFCLKMIGIALCSVVVLLLLLYGMHVNERKTVLESVPSIDTIAPLASQEKKEIISEHICSIVSEYKDDPYFDRVTAEKMVKERIRVSNGTTHSAIVDEVMNKIQQYKEARLHGTEIVLCLAAGLIVGLFPLFRIWYQVQTLLEGAVYEVRQFYSVIWMERALKGVTIPSLLEDMEIFSSTYKGVLRRCINTYSAGPEQALLRMKEEGASIHGGFAELADAFLSVDDVGVANAFGEVENNRGMLEKMTELEAEITLEKRRDSTDLITKIPMLLTVGAYFIVPFFLYSLQGVFEIFALLEELRI